MADRKNTDLVEGVLILMLTAFLSASSKLEELFKRDPFQFEHWIVERVGGFPTKKDLATKELMAACISRPKKVSSPWFYPSRGGKLRLTDVRDLRGVLPDGARDTELAGFLLPPRAPSKAMRDVSADIRVRFQYGGDNVRSAAIPDCEGKSWRRSESFTRRARWYRAFQPQQHSLPFLTCFLAN